MSQKGFPANAFSALPNPTEGYICRLCNGVYHNAVITPCCKAKFCRGCILDISPEGKCVCKETLHSEQLIPDTPLNEIIAALELCCPCCHNWKGPAGRLIPDHCRVNCIKWHVPCPRCNCSVPRESMDDHSEHFCPLVPCRHCGGLVSRTEMEEHLALCDRYPESCPFPGCPVKVARGDLSQHVEEGLGRHLILMQRSIQCHFKDIEQMIENLAVRVDALSPAPPPSAPPPPPSVPAPVPAPVPVPVPAPAPVLPPAPPVLPVSVSVPAPVPSPPPPPHPVPRPASASHTLPPPPPPASGVESPVYRLFACGNNNHAVLGNECPWNPADRPVDRPIDLTPSFLASLRPVALCGSGDHSLALTPQGEVYAWGRGSYGRLGTGTAELRVHPTVVVGQLAGQRVVQIACGWKHSVALTKLGQVFTWGHNERGQLGDGSLEDRLLPVCVRGALAQRRDGTVPRVKQVAAFYFHTLALTDNGEVFAWGRNGEGQLGDGTTEDKTFPVRVGDLPEDVASIAAGGFHSLALTRGGRLFAWGGNGYGKLGDGTTTQRSRPKPITLPNRELVSQVAANSFHTVALTRQGTVYAWGWNKHGSLGARTAETQTLRKIRVDGLPPVGRIAAGDGHVIAVSTDGQHVYAWGRNDHGQLGNGAVIDQYTPVEVNLAGCPRAKMGVGVGGLHSFFWTIGAVGGSE